tara:strand:+ start:163 stop:690 length:528 start_codon:yes stop_codon:yes gene_type:complete
MSIRNYLDNTPSLGSQVYIDPTAVLIGQVTLGADASLWPLSVVRGDVNHIHIGARSNIQDQSMLHVSRPSDSNPEGHPLILGEEVTIGHQVMLHGCTIGDRVLVGIGSIILDGAVVEDEVMIGAGSLISPGKVLESGYLYLGRPAQKRRALTDEEKLTLKTSAEHYVRLKNHYLD